MQKIKTVQPYKLLKVLFSDRSTAKSNAIKVMLITFVFAIIPPVIGGDGLLVLILLPTILLLILFPYMIYNPMLKDEYVPKKSYAFIRKLAKKELPSFLYDKEDEELRMFHSDVDYNTNVDLNETFGVNDKLIISYQNFDFEKKHMEDGDYLLGVSVQSLYCVYKKGSITKTKMSFDEIETIGLMLSIPNAYILQFRNNKNEEINVILYKETSLVVHPLLFINSLLDALDSYIENGGRPASNSSRRRVVINKGESSSGTSNQTVTSGVNRNIDISENHGAKTEAERSSSSRVLDFNYTSSILKEMADASYVDSNRKIEL